MSSKSKSLLLVVPSYVEQPQPQMFPSSRRGYDRGWYGDGARRKCQICWNIGHIVQKCFYHYDSTLYDDKAGNPRIGSDQKNFNWDEPSSWATSLSQPICGTQIMVLVVLSLIFYSLLLTRWSTMGRCVLGCFLHSVCLIRCRVVRFLPILLFSLWVEEMFHSLHYQLLP